MDWSRAKTILLISFLFVNIVLGYQLLAREMKQGEPVVNAEEIAKETTRLLQEKNITVPNGIPKEAPKLKEITMKLNSSYNKDEIVKFKTPVHVSSFMNQIIPREHSAKMDIPRLEEYQFDSAVSKPNAYVMNQIYEGLPLFDVTIQLIEQEGQITSYRQAYAEIDTTNDEKEAVEQKVISPYIAISNLAEKILPSDTVIDDIKLGYHGQQFDSPILYLIPHWRVTTSSKKAYYIHAFTGAIESTQDVGKEQAKE